MPSDKKILEPRCMPKHGAKDFRMSPAVTNRGELIPCCWCDPPRASKDPIMKQMLKVSKISDYNNIEDSVDELVGIVHSHPQDIVEFSETDKYSCKAIDLTFYLVSPKSDKMAVIRPDEIDA